MFDLEMPSADGQSVWDCFLSPTWFATLLVADDLGIFTALASEPASVDELAGRTGFNRRALGAVLPLLSSLGFLAPRGGRYHVTDTATHYLLPQSSFYWGALFVAHREDSPLCAQLREVLTTRDPTSAVPEPLGNDPIGDGWAAGDITLERSRGVIAYMHAHSAAAAIGLAQNSDFSRTTRLLDVGGCSGCYSVALTRRNPSLSCTIMDLPAVCELAEGYIAESGLSDRIDTLGADMFRATWPSGYDAVLFSNVFHDWRSETCAELVRRSFAALAPGGTINLHEMLLNDDGSGPRTAASFAVAMLIGNEGRQFRYTELEEMLLDGGFERIECRSTSPNFSLVRGHKPSS